MVALPSERPRERCLSQGPACLSLRECLALLIGTGPAGQGSLGVASQLLSRAGSEQDERAFFSSMESGGASFLKGLPGLGPAIQARILAAFEIGRRYAAYREARERPPLSFKGRSLPERAVALVPESLRMEPQEWLGFVPLLRNAQLAELAIVEKGARTHVNVDPAELFARILALRPAGFFLFHNHPSGELEPSPADIELTRQVRGVAQQLGIRLLGHAIITTRAERWIVV